MLDNLSRCDYLHAMTTAEKLQKVLNEFMVSPDGYSMDELHELYCIAKALKDRAAVTIVEFNWEEKPE